VAKKGGPWVGFDLGGTKMLAAVFDTNMKMIGRTRKKTKGSSDSGVSLSRIVKTIRGALEEAGFDGKVPAGIGVGVPGTLDLEHGIVVEAPNLGWRHILIRELLEKEFNCPVVIINDVDAGVYGEYRFGAAKGARCALGIFPGTGIGGGCIYDGNIFHGKTNSCMEIGHIPVDPDGKPCGCGRRGCLETVASRLAISAAAAMAVYRGQAPILAKLAGTDIMNIRSGVLAQAIKEGDAVIENIVKRAARILGRATAGMINIIAPDVIVLGGGLVEAMPDLYKNEIEKSILRHIMPTYEQTCSIKVAKLGDDATAFGAAGWAQSIVKSEK